MISKYGDSLTPNFMWNINLKIRAGGGLRTKLFQTRGSNVSPRAIASHNIDIVKVLQSTYISPPFYLSILISVLHVNRFSFIEFRVFIKDGGKFVQLTESSPVTSLAEGEKKKKTALSFFL